MDPNTAGLIVLAEQLAALLAKTIVDIKSVFSSSNTATVDQILADADAQFDQIIANAKAALPPAPSSAAPAGN